MVDKSANTEIRNNLPQLSLAERDRRWKAVREKMSENSLDCLLVWGNDIFWSSGMANFRYLTQIGSRHGGFLIFPLSGNPVVFNSPLHMNKPFNAFALAQEWVDDVRPNLGIKEVIETFKTEFPRAKRIGLVGKASQISSDIVTYRDYSILVTELKGVSVIESDALLDTVRMFKSKEEISFLDKSGDIALKAIEKLIDTTAVGVKENELLASMLYTQIANGAEAEIFNFLHSEPIEGNDKLRHLLHGVEQPVSPTTRQLREGDLVITEFHTSYGGYLTAAEFSVFVGRIPDPLKRISEICIECLDSALEKFKPGNTVSEVVEAIRRPAKKAGLDFVELGFHGHGLSSPEFPTVVLKPGFGILSGEGIEDFVLQENMVFGTNIDIFDPAWKSDVGLMFGDTVVVKDKPLLMVNTPRYLPEKN
ncbi:MAG: Xaa-Pro peptidase family protein [Bacillota bacterium]|nr:Xaa-Pro peptidase family protein [Bacillota bacterium]